MIAVYGGTFDPVTKGHLDVVKRSLKLSLQELHIAIGVNPSKNPWFSAEERKDLILKTLELDIPSQMDKIKVSSFEGLLVEFCKSVGATCIIRGVRNVSDYQYELNVLEINRYLSSEIETIFLPAAPELSVVSSSNVKQIVHFGGDISKFVSKPVEEALFKRIKKA